MHPTDRNVSIGAVYATIERLTTKGFGKHMLKSEAGTRARSFFTLTPPGGARPRGTPIFERACGQASS
jgi:hypothetical protein